MFKPRKFATFRAAFQFRSAHHMEDKWDIVEFEGSHILVANIVDAVYYLTECNVVALSA